jgi:hypothetical protein
VVVAESDGFPYRDTGPYDGHVLGYHTHGFNFGKWVGKAQYMLVKIPGIVLFPGVF